MSPDSSPTPHPSARTSLDSVRDGYNLSKAPYPSSRTSHICSPVRSLSPASSLLLRVRPPRLARPQPRQEAVDNSRVSRQDRKRFVAPLSFALPFLFCSPPFPLPLLFSPLLLVLAVAAAYQVALRRQEFAGREDVLGEMVKRGLAASAAGDNGGEEEGRGGKRARLE